MMVTHQPITQRHQALTFLVGPQGQLCVAAFVLHVLDVDWLLSAAVYCVTPALLSLAITMHGQKHHMHSGGMTAPSLNGWRTYSWLSYFLTDSSVFWSLLGAAVCWWALYCSTSVKYPLVINLHDSSHLKIFPNRLAHSLIHPNSFIPTPWCKQRELSTLSNLCSPCWPRGHCTHPAVCC